MSFVLCPCCGSRVEVPSDAIGRDRRRLWDVIVCDTCDASFDYDDEDIQIVDDQPADSLA
ncbi:MAG: hypothetical protein IAF94_17800 [Pirellulaceae bacterium]|nr:hypothetical protein [Pirellulaceae bacterium]